MDHRTHALLAGLDRDARERLAAAALVTAALELAAALPQLDVSKRRRHALLAAARLADPAVEREWPVEGAPNEGVLRALLGRTAAPTPSELRVATFVLALFERGWRRSGDVQLNRATAELVVGWAPHGLIQPYPLDGGLTAALRDRTAVVTLCPELPDEEAYAAISGRQTTLEPGDGDTLRALSARRALLLPTARLSAAELSAALGHYAGPTLIAFGDLEPVAELHRWAVAERLPWLATEDPAVPISVWHRST